MTHAADVAVTVLTVPLADSELGADRLMIAGAFAIEERITGENTVELRAVLGDAEAAVRTRLAPLSAGWSLHTERVDAAPLETWREFAEPIRVTADLVVRPAWLPALAEPGVVEVAIEPGSTFGLGDHPTTRLSAAAVWRTAGGARTMLDVGSGSGVLAIIALLAGAEQATAIDVSGASPPAVLDNADRNHVTGRITASTTPLAEVAGTFDLVAANILAPTLVALAGDLQRAMAPEGALIISGVLAERHDHVLEALQPMRAVRTDVLDGWAAVELRHP